MNQMISCSTPDVVPIPIRKPSASEFIRVHPDYEQVHQLNLKNYQDQWYLAHPGRDANQNRSPHSLFLCVSSTQRYFFWPVKCEHLDNSWMISSFKAIHTAIWHWVTISSDQKCQKYQVKPVETPLLEPVWPQQSILELLNQTLQPTQNINLN